MNTALKRPRRLSVSVVVLGALAAGFLLLSIGQLAHHPPATQSDIWTSAELVEGYAHCDSVLRLVFEGSHNVTSKETGEPDVSWNQSCMEKIQPHATVGFVSLAVGVLLGTMGVVALVKHRKRPPLASAD